jgi:hypothetical protein
MTVYTWDGRVLHHRDCTYCRFRQDVVIKKPRQVREICRLKRNDIPHPYSPERYCEHYSQIHCGCDECNREEVM